LRERPWILCDQLSRLVAKESERKLGAKISTAGKFLRFFGTLTERLVNEHSANYSFHAAFPISLTNVQAHT